MSEIQEVPFYNPVDCALQGRFLLRQSHWKVEHSEAKKGGYCSGIIDTSLESEGKPCPIFLNEPRWVIRLKAIEITLLSISPVFLIHTVFPHLFRIPIIIVYLAGKIFYDYLTQDKNASQQSFLHFLGKYTWLMVKETARSLVEIVRTPFYWTGVLLSAVYMIFDPLNGRKMLGLTLLAWNHYIDFKRDDQFKLIGFNTYYPTPCMVPVAYALKDAEDGQWKICDRHGNIKFKNSQNKSETKEVNLPSSDAINNDDLDKPTEFKEPRKITFMSEAPSCIFFCWDKEENLFETQKS